MILESKIRQSLAELNCSADALAIISDVGKSRLSRAFRGLQDFSGPEAEHLMKIIADMRELKDSVQPFPLSFATRDARTIRNLLPSRKEAVRWTIRITTEET